LTEESQDAQPFNEGYGLCNNGHVDIGDILVLILHLRTGYEIHALFG